MRLVLASAAAVSLATAEPVQLSGIYPHLAMFNSSGECGTGAVVPWADQLWVVTYSPHSPRGSDDKLYSVSPDLVQTIHPESIGGTPANRMIHRESQQLFIGPYAIDREGTVRAIPYSAMPGRPTGNARHLFDPTGKIYSATMEEGFYEVDVKTLAVSELFADDQKQGGPAAAGKRLAALPGYHGKGLYSGQGVLVYANNGEKSNAARKDPTIPSGCLAEWDGKSKEWTVVRRNQFTEVTGPGGIHGNPNPATDPIWAVGWDSKSLLLAVREPEKGWSFYRLPKGSHSYDGAHGWNTEWPRIREIGEDGGKSLLMTMHGTFWKFPKTFSTKNSAGILPRSNYLKIVGDFCRWGDRLVLGCDDVAQREFLNKRKAKGEIAAAQSQSNLWFLEPDQLDKLGPAIGRGLVWENEDVTAGALSDPFLFSGYDHRGLHLHHATGKPATISLEIDRDGTGTWTPLREVRCEDYTFVSFVPEEKGAWIRLRAETAATALTAAFTYRNRDPRTAEADLIFAELAKPGDQFTGGLVRARDKNKGTLSFIPIQQDGTDLGHYELNASLDLVSQPLKGEPAWSLEHTAIPKNRFLTVDEASVVFLDDDGRRWRLPKGEMGTHPLGDYRIAREVVTERDLFNADGTIYELPANNAGGFRKIRPIATHNRLIHDLCGFRGLLILSGVATETPLDNEHVIKSRDGKTALWAGAIDDLWKLGKPRGTGGPWKDSKVVAGVPSDPYLMTAYDRKSLTLTASKPATITAEVDLTGDGTWAPYRSFQVDDTLTHTFPDAFSAYWIRFSSSTDCTASALLEYK